MWKSTPVLADINGDGFVDLAALSRLGNGAHVWLGDGKGQWRDASAGLSVPASCGGGVAFGDMNKDGYLDLAVADHCAGVSVYLGDGQGHWNATTQGLNPGASQRKPSESENGEQNEFLGAEDVAVGDVNEDGYLDLVVASRQEGGITVYFGDGSGKSWKESTSDGLPKSGFALKVMLRDIDGDGHLDIIATSEHGPRVWRGDGKGHWRDYSRGLPVSSAGGYYRGLAIGDVNEDGRLDLAVAHIRNGAEIYLQTKDGGWQAAPPLQSSIKAGATAVALGDLDGDGHLDLVVGGREIVPNRSGLFVFGGNGKGGWSELATNLPLNDLTFIWSIILADVDGDGVPDLIVTTGDSLKRRKTESLPRMQVWLNQYHKDSHKP
ncbi:MAG: VCBS repeat-containing protein [Deltaproteobacteria bacterium]|nr:VCBS repeat-containing protein [Deltaproteobacteria bacterium]